MVQIKNVKLLTENISKKRPCFAWYGNRGLGL